MILEAATSRPLAEKAEKAEKAETSGAQA